jgi:hypothetical protein
LSSSGSKDEGATWSEKFLAHAKRSGIKDIVFSKDSYPKSSEGLIRIKMKAKE